MTNAQSVKNNHTGTNRPPERKRLHGKEKLLLEAYDPREYERSQRQNGHAQGEMGIIQTQSIGNHILILGCGPGWLDRALVNSNRPRLLTGKTRMRIMAIDAHPGNIEYARNKMKELTDKNPRLKSSIDVTYLLARLGDSVDVSYQNVEYHVPEISEITANIRNALHANYPDTIIACMIFWWVQKREEAIRSVKRLCGPNTIFLNVEEHPVHIVENEFTRGAFVRGATRYMRPPESIQEWWTTLTNAGFCRINEGTVPIVERDRHTLHYRTMKLLD